MPGVPPDALNNLKRAFKGMFRRSKKKTDTTQSQTDGTAPSAAPTSSAQQVSQNTTDAPQLPPIENTAGSPFGGSAAGSTTDTSKPLPPTHPLSTGQQSQPQEAVPQNHDAQPGPPAPVATAPAPAEASNTNAPSENAEALKQEPLEPGRVSPLNPGSAVEDSRSGAVSAVEGNSPTDEPVKTDSGLEPPNAGGADESKANDAAPAPPLDENAPPTTAATTAAEQPATNGTVITAERDQKPPTADPGAEEKVAVTMEEAPPIRGGPTAPGMSATSGPLEEFPEGGYVAKDNEHH